jgi:hypothetical protein
VQIGLPEITDILYTLTLNFNHSMSLIYAIVRDVLVRLLPVHTGFLVNTVVGSLQWSNNRLTCTYPAERPRIIAGIDWVTTIMDIIKQAFQFTMDKYAQYPPVVTIIPALTGAEELLAGTGRTGTHNVPAVPPVWVPVNTNFTTDQAQRQQLIAEGTEHIFIPNFNRTMRGKRIARVLEETTTGHNRTRVQQTLTETQTQRGAVDGEYVSIPPILPNATAIATSFNAGTPSYTISGGF